MTKPLRDGEAVVDTSTGSIGIVYDDQVRKSGPNKGKILVLFECSVSYLALQSADPDDLIRVELHAKKIVTKE